MNTIITKLNRIIIASTLLTGSIAISKDLGFRFKNGKCANDQQNIGLNPGFFGQCSDLRGVVLGRFNLDEYDFSGSDFTGADLQKSTLKKAILEKVNFESANLAGVNFEGAKIKDSNFTKTNFKNSILSDVAAENCNFNKADFSGLDLTYFSPGKSNFSEAKFIKIDGSGTDFSQANLNKSDFTTAKLIGANFTKANFSGAIFKNADLEEVVATGADLTKADFRFSNLLNIKIEGAKMQAAIFNRKTILSISKQKAEDLGMIFTISGTVMVLWDRKSNELTQLQKALEEEGMEVSYSQKPEFEFDGSELTGDFDTVIHLNGDTYSQTMLASGQKALVKFVKGGGTFIHAELNGYETDNNAMTDMTELSLFPYVGTSGPFSFSAIEGKRAHPLLEGIPANVNLSVPVATVAKVRNFAENAAEVVMQNKNQNSDVVAFRKLGQGTVVGFSFGCTYTNENIPNCLADKTVQKLYINAVNFGLN